MPAECTPTPMQFARLDGRAVMADFGGGVMTSDAGALLLGATDRAIGLVDRFAACFSDGREAGRVVHDVATLVGQRVFGIALGYEDLIDHDELRHDPALGVVLGRLEARRAGCAPLAGKSTLNRLEHAPTGAHRYRRIGHEPAAIETLFVDLFLDAHGQAPAQLILDLDATDDPLHGRQEGRFFHAYYDCYCYLPLYIFCGDHLLAAKLRRSDIDASAGATDEVARIVARIRERWPEVQIVLRADSGFAREALMAWCEEHGVDYVFGLARNARLAERIGADLARAERDAGQSGETARRFADFSWSTLKSWSRERRVVAKAEWMPGHRGAARRAGLAVLCLTLLGFSAPTAAQTVPTVVSNLGQGDDTLLSPSVDVAQRFHTGSNSTGYTLSSVEIESDDHEGDAFSVSVCTTDGSGRPTTTCTALTAPSSFAAGTISFRAPMDFIRSWRASPASSTRSWKRTVMSGASSGTRRSGSSSGCVTSTASSGSAGTRPIARAGKPRWIGRRTAWCGRWGRARTKV